MKASGKILPETMVLLEPHTKFLEASSNKIHIRCEADKDMASLTKARTPD